MIKYLQHNLDFDQIQVYKSNKLDKNIQNQEKLKKTTSRKKLKDVFSIIKKTEVEKESQDYAIYIKNFSKIFKKFKAVDNATIKVKKGTIHGFIGPNGSGKTTTIKCLISAIKPTSGQLLIYGMDSATIEAKKHIGYIPESARFPKKITTYNYLVSMAQISGLTKKQAVIKAEEILKNLNLWNFKKRNPNNYSSGMKKKVLLAQSLLNNPDILVLDEPAANLDPTARTELFNDLKKLRDQGKTIFISSHILSELQNLIDEVTILNYSKVAFQGVVNQTEIKYEISTNDNKKLIEILKENNIGFEKHQENLLIDIDNENDEKINQLISLALKAKITIKLWKPYIVDLQTIYEKIVINENSNSTRKGKK